jgi:5-methylcytosine-specific restriction endonuclease McrA
MAFHVSLDTYHRARTADAQSATLSRDHFTCQVCSAQSPDVIAHLWRQPRLLPSYRLEHFVALCADCHEAAHARGVQAVASLGCDWESYRASVARRTHAKAAG